MSLKDEFSWRGLLQDISDQDAFNKLKQGDSFYIGFDPTAPSLQVGNLVMLIVAIHLTKLGLRPLILFGGATGMIGDPGGRSTERNLLPLEEVASNVRKQEQQAARLWANSGSNVAPKIVNNIDWTKGVTLIDFLRDIGKHFTVNYMLQKDSVKSRLSGEGISYTEFSYMLLQSFDFLHLYYNEGCRLQFGGSDQWGNITAGLELIRRKVQGEAYGFSVPLVTNSEGKKFGKSAGNAIWLDPTMTSPFKFHQFWLNTPDSDVIKLLKIFTFESEERIAELEKGLVEDPEKREAQKFLADYVCSMVHGQSATEDAKRCAAALFGGSLEGLSNEQILDMFSDAPSSTISADEANKIDILTLLATTVATSKGEARRLAQGGGLYIDGVRLNDPSLPLSSTALATKGFIILRSGKKNYHLVKMG
jgi:tyrosyl-tRNA synthetase